MAVVRSSPVRHPPERRIGAHRPLAGRPARLLPGGLREGRGDRAH